MIIQSLCNTCLQPYTVLVELSDRPLLDQMAGEAGLSDCPRLCGGKINLVGDPTISQMNRDPRLKEPLTLSVKELYKAVNGAGLPDEVPKTVDTVRQFAKGARVRDVKLEKLHGHVYIHEIVLSNGVTLHLTSGTNGAVVLKMTKERGSER